MLNFLGKYGAKLDPKARVFVPAVFRKILQASSQNTLILRKDIFQECLVLYPAEVWEKEVGLLRARLNRWDRDQQQLFRQFVMDAERLEFDANGRILIPKRYMQMLGDDAGVVFLGVDNTIELWSKNVLEDIAIPVDDFSIRIQNLMNKECGEIKGYE